MAGLVPPAVLEQIRSASDIVDIIGSYIPLKRAGANFVALCPFHQEKTPSFNVNPHKQIFHCFGCHKGGDVFRFVQDYENISFPEAIERLAARAAIPLQFEQGPGQERARHLKDSLFQIHEQITQRWHSLLTNDAQGQVAREYLANRGVSEEAVKLFRLGYAPDTWDDTVNWAVNKSYELSLIEQAGLIVGKEGNAGYYSRFRGRLMFPICDEQGRVIGFSGRILAPEENAAKYVNSPETPLFTKGKVIFGLDKSKRALLDANSAIICEGQLDLISCYMAGVQNIVAPQGTALTSEHVRILKRYVEEVILCFDSDKAGQNAAIRSLDDLLASGLAIRVAMIPAPHDPDSFIKSEGGKAFKDLIERAEGFFDFYLNHLCATNDLSTDRGCTAVVRAMAEAVHKTGNSVVEDNYAQKTALRLAVSPSAVREEFKTLRRANKQKPGAQSTAAPAGELPDRPPPQEYWLLKLLLKEEEEEHLDFVAAHLDLDWLQHAGLKEIVQRRLTAHHNHSWQGVASLISGLEAESSRSLLSEAAAEPRALPNARQQLTDLLLRLRNHFIDEKLMTLAQRASSPDIADSERNRLLQQQQDLRLLKRQPLTPISNVPVFRSGCVEKE
jgi:DNA primase